MTNIDMLETTSVKVLLPDELWLAIFGHLGPRDLARAQATCARWNLLTCDDALWRPLLTTAAIVGYDPSALAADDLTGIALKDVCACRFLRLRRLLSRDRTTLSLRRLLRGA